jgi:D-inositol-3-phosphate glycosyltransferase
MPSRNASTSKTNSPTTPMKDKLKIVIIGSAYPLRGGLSNYNERLAREFLSQEHEVRIETFSLQYPSLLFPGKSQYSDSPKPKDLNIRVSINSINPLNWLQVGNRIKKEKPDLVIIKFWIPFMGPCFGTILRRIRKNKHTQVISIIDNIIPHEKRPGDKFLSGYFVKAVDAFVTMSRSVLNDLDLFDKSKPKVYSPHPLYDNFGDALPKPDARKKLNLGGNEKVILFFGFIRDYKGLDILLGAMQDKEIKKLKIKLLVAGEFYTDSKPYFDLIKKYGLKDSVVMSNDFIPDAEVGTFFCASDLVVQPYKTATQSGVTQIAYHFDKPMVTTDVGGLAEIVPDGKVGYVVKPEVSEISEAIVRFFKEDKAALFIDNIEIEKQKYTWERMTASIYSLLDSVKNNRK